MRVRSYCAVRCLLSCVPFVCLQQYHNHRCSPYEHILTCPFKDTHTHTTAWRLRITHEKNTTDANTVGAGHSRVVCVRFASRSRWFVQPWWGTLILVNYCVISSESQRRCRRVRFGGKPARHSESYHARWHEHDSDDDVGDFCALAPTSLNICSTCWAHVAYAITSRNLWWWVFFTGFQHWDMCVCRFACFFHSWTFVRHKCTMHAGFNEWDDTKHIRECERTRRKSACLRECVCVYVQCDCAKTQPTTHTVFAWAAVASLGPLLAVFFLFVVVFCSPQIGCCYL